MPISNNEHIQHVSERVNKLEIAVSSLITNQENLAKDIASVNQGLSHLADTVEKGILALSNDLKLTNKNFSKTREPKYGVGLAAVIVCLTMIGIYIKSETAPILERMDRRVDSANEVQSILHMNLDTRLSKVENTIFKYNDPN
jgi:hypothetical protein